MKRENPWQQKIHLEPPCGWLNDPNGLCFFKGKYHVFFQYTPMSALGEGNRCWGHYESADFTNWEFTGTVIFPDCKYDKDGAFSGSAIVKDGVMHIFYTGNVIDEGDFDYITAGRGANVIHITTEDARNFSPKDLIFTNSDYPSDLSCHVRDPKIYIEGGVYKMVLGGRTLDDKGCVLIYRSSDLEVWEYEGRHAKDDFGYMWECPDLININSSRYLSLSPQGVKRQKTSFQNVYSSGYFTFNGEQLADFHEWDKGFDWYAPQSFLAPDGRRILIGWMGIGDAAYENPTIEYGFQHCLTIPREVVQGSDGVLLQKPIAEIKALRKESLNISDGEKLALKLPFELELDASGEFELEVGDAKVSFSDSLACLEFFGKSGYGRTYRYAELERCSDIRVIADRSSLEIFLHSGKAVMSSRFYPDSESVDITLRRLSGKAHLLGAMNITLSGD